MSLELESISVAFGGFKALDDVTISLKKAEIVGLIGPNGAGKTTCVNIITQAFRTPRQARSCWMG
ncbi:ATP-binding cassette domain-containing protein, partial [Salipiger marinus]|uniref:ATP-binding cassette domain-containing protein n=1 Tax=Salipiger marinus TaxID=555512 RepID=UPI00362A4649